MLILTYLIDLRVWLIVLKSIVKHEHKVRHHVVNAEINCVFQFLRNFLQVNGPLDHLIVIRVFLQPNFY
jgi:hypothetical protein